MSSIGKTVRNLRHAVGMSQAVLADESGASLATVQNIEADRANPSLSTLEKVLAPLGHSMAIEPRAADWEALAVLGLPLSTSGEPGPVDSASLRRLIQQAALELARDPPTPDHERKSESLVALLMAIRRHYPSKFRQWFGRSPLIRDLLPDEPSGRLIKLSRIALARVAEVL